MVENREGVARRLGRRPEIVRVVGVQESVEVVVVVVVWS